MTIIYDSLYSYFSVEVFITQLLNNFLFPLFVPYFLYRYGVWFIYSQDFLRAYVFSFIPSFVLIGIAVVIIMEPDVQKKETLAYMSIVPIFICFTHRCMVALKYAALSPTEYM
jgi:hypothetical protein